MPSAKKRTDFFDSVEGAETKAKLEALVKNSAYNTRDSFSANSDNYPDGIMPFVDEHMEYLRTHPNIDINHYISNLRLRTRSH